MFKAEEFLNADVLVIMYDYYDHLDHQSKLKIALNIKKIITPIGVGAHLEYWNIDSDKINELSWG